MREMDAYLLTLILGKRPFLTLWRQLRVVDGRQFHGSSSSSRLMGWPQDMRSSTSWR